MRYSIPLLLLFLILSCSSKIQKEEVEVQSNSLKEEIIEDEVLVSYDDLKADASNKRDDFRKLYNSCDGNKVKQDSIIINAQEYLLDISDQYFKAWYGTPWAFHGHSKVPKEGNIACGYFVTTTLKDMGFDIPRIKWAQQASEYLIKKVSNDIKRFHKAPMTDIVDYIKVGGEGLYIVGLDSHVGYIYYRNGKIAFVHTNYYRPQIGVMSEPLSGRNPLNDSKYRVIGKIMDKEMVRNWILNTPYSE
ncbi:hypothetical protein [Dysgonomonas sp. ZJ709]|uniref:hypothetical protein n=1 Tax=Dysgonomonas sp. ZJ709 TaxID=2709797 RepID=UPI0013ECD81B|nr:hypothetical protein [Dysgonomonas sp. ZJ709]